MGLSRRLGPISRRQEVDTPESVHYQWSTQAYTVQDILTKFRLPCVAQCAVESCTVMWSDFNFDLRQPLLMHSERQGRKVHARSLRPGPGGVPEEFGPHLAIPEDYDGWFAAAPKGVTRVKRHYRVQGIADSTCQRFLVTTKLPAFVPAGNTQHLDHSVMPGEILRKVCVLEETGKNVPQIVKSFGPCLECLDEKDEAVLVPLNRRSLLFEIDTEYPGDGFGVFQIQSVIEGGNSQLPRLVSVVHGDPPILDYSFTGVLRLYTIFTEDTLLAATMDEENPMCLELSTDSITKFKLGLNEAIVKKTIEFANAIQMCESFGPKFVTGIKVSFPLTPSHIESGDSSVKNDNSSLNNGSGSDTQEVDANNEFEISWGTKEIEESSTLPPSWFGDPLPDKESTEYVEEHTLSQDSQDTQGQSPRRLSNSPIFLAMDKTEVKENSPSLVKPNMTVGEYLQNIKERKTVATVLDFNEHSSSTDLESSRESETMDNPMFFVLQKNKQSMENTNLLLNDKVTDPGSSEMPQSLQDIFSQTQQSLKSSTFLLNKHDSENTNIIESESQNNKNKDKFDKENNSFKQPDTPLSVVEVTESSTLPKCLVVSFESNIKRDSFPRQEQDISDGEFPNKINLIDTETEVLVDKKPVENQTSIETVKSFKLDSVSVTQAQEYNEDYSNTPSGSECGISDEDTPREMFSSVKSLESRASNLHQENWESLNSNQNTINSIEFCGNSDMKVSEEIEMKHSELERSISITKESEEFANVVDRLSTLMDEVTHLVDTSNENILDIHRKENTKQDKLDNKITSVKGSKLDLIKSDKMDLQSVKLKSNSSIDTSSLNLKKKRNGSWNVKKKSQNAMNIFSQSSDKQMLTEASSGSLRRARGQRDLASIDKLPTEAESKFINCLRFRSESNLNDNFKYDRLSNESLTTFERKHSDGNADRIGQDQKFVRVNSLRLNSDSIVKDYEDKECEQGKKIDANGKRHLSEIFESDIVEGRDDVAKTGHPRQKTVRPNLVNLNFDVNNEDFV